MNIRKITMVALSSLLAMGVAVSLYAQTPKTATHNGNDTALVPQTVCPVMGNAIDKTLYTDYNGKRIYVCCQSCLATVQKNPQMYINKLTAMGQCAVYDSAWHNNCSRGGDSTGAVRMTHGNGCCW